MTQKLAPILYTSALIDSIKYYEEVLGFKRVAFSQEDEWAKMCRGNIEVMLSTPNKHQEFSGSLLTGSLYIYCDDVKSLWEELKDKTEVIYPLEKFSYGMEEFGVKDCNGYMLNFGKEYEV